MSGKIKVAITGANGYIGGVVSKILAANGYEITPLTRKEIELTDASALQNYLDSNPKIYFDHWINMAADQSVMSMEENTAESFEEMFQVNVKFISLLYK